MSANFRAYRAGSDAPVLGYPAQWGVNVQTSGGGYFLAIPPAMPIAEAKAVATVLAAAPKMLATLKLAEATISGTLKARGYEPGSCADEWSAEVRAEVAALAKIRAVIVASENIR